MAGRSEFSASARGKDRNCSTQSYLCRGDSHVFPSSPVLKARINEMDWQGQKHAEMLMQIFLVFSAVAAFGAGYLMRDFRLMMLIYAGGVVLTALVTVPNWPYFNRHPLKWLDPSEAEKHPKPQVSNITSSSSSKKKASKNK
ncbi:Microsomal signal peptidase 12 kDa subunit family protein [Rhynchospora pubera]|uniref:Signal peptidase complex subunit 1 n=2 Tax=Rhynchospora pubera TaxID=906938 RepID=A0AAV8HTY9_9POAL|nr:Microsomal signal peptidase 12 kDa subunit family protein [Rhynchospora pubera]